ncbi:CHAP domain-containing protein [Eubacterium callanderi]|uniref:CHAP domain-containing protein n=1 Tax=Eubacterium callanderi TaxID=53442 RepID=A0A853JT73_9FIRM|nr:CHAP domain-containing protein [Eubacterium callanderi]
MSKEIKTREVKKDIKFLDKAKAATYHVKENTIRTKNALEHVGDRSERSPDEYAQNQVMDKGSRAVKRIAEGAQKQGDRLFHHGVNQYRAGKRTDETAAEAFEAGQAVKEAGSPIKTREAVNAMERNAQKSRNKPGKAADGKTIKQSIYSSAKSARATENVLQKNGRRTIKTSEKTGRLTIKTGEEATRLTKRSIRTVKPGVKKGRAVAQANAKATKTAAKASARAAKAASKASAKAAQQSARMAAKASEATAKMSVQAAKLAIKVTATAAKALAAAGKALASALASGGAVVVLIIMIVVLFGGALCLIGGSNATAAEAVSEEVQAYTPLIQKYAAAHGIPDYVELIKAVMMQESGGRGGDPMQCSECGYNDQYPEGITDPEYSINIGIRYLADCLNAAGVTSPMDLEHIKLALQGYNFGAGYITWALEKDGGYTQTNAQEFANLHGGNYGDVSYVPNVLRYYPFGRIPTGGGNSSIVNVAASQVGNVGGEPYWSWYGFSSRVEWCACFVSWCADQCGYIDAGIIPKFSYVPDGVAYFQSKGQWQDGSYTPKAGDIIFFTWDGSGGSDHVGIVESVIDGTVNTIEGNTTDSCARRSYALGSYVILGYGCPGYTN